MEIQFFGISIEWQGKPIGLGVDERKQDEIKKL
jgi:hypothetical protein